MKEYVQKPIQLITNLSMKLGRHPDLPKQGQKKKDKPESYRPVNILPGPGRIMDMFTSEQ